MLHWKRGVLGVVKTWFSIIGSCYDFTVMHLGRCTEGLIITRSTKTKAAALWRQDNSPVLKWCGGVSNWRLLAADYLTRLFLWRKQCEGTSLSRSEPKGLIRILAIASPQCARGKKWGCLACMLKNSPPALQKKSCCSHLLSHFFTQSWF